MKFSELTIPESRSLNATSLLISYLKNIDNFSFRVKLVINYFRFKVDHYYYTNFIIKLPISTFVIHENDNDIVFSGIY